MANSFFFFFLVPTVGIVFSNGPRWHSLRNFALGVLRELGVGRSTIEDRILEEAACVLDEFQATMGVVWQGKHNHLVWGRGWGGRGGWMELCGGGTQLLCEGARGLRTRVSSADLTKCHF